MTLWMQMLSTREQQNDADTDELAGRSLQIKLLQY
jgi:hypothetical protein